MARFIFVVLFFSMLGQVAKCLAKPPNILWLSAEDIGPHLGCYGDDKAITPNLDSLAQQGVIYTHAFTTAGVCAPCLLYTSPSPRDGLLSRMPSSA